MAALRLSVHWHLPRAALHKRVPLSRCRFVGRTVVQRLAGDPLRRHHEVTRTKRACKLTRHDGRPWPLAGHFNDLSLEPSPILSAFGGSGRRRMQTRRYRSNKPESDIQCHRRACESLLGGARDCALASAVAHDQHHGVSVMYFSALRLWNGSAKQCRCRCATELCGGTWKQKTRSGRGVHCPRRSRSSPGAHHHKTITLCA